MKSKISYLLAPAVICWCLSFLVGCKDPAIEDKNLLTSDDNLTLSKDTLSVKVFSEFEKPQTATGVVIGLVGSLNDPAFGKTYSGFYMQCLLPSNNIYFGDNPQLDSAFLMLKYSGVYGKFDQPIDINLYELSQSMSDSTPYKTNDAFSVYSAPVGSIPSYTLGTKLTDSIYTTYNTLAPHLRIPLTASFGNKILTDSTNLVNNSVFLNYFKGFYLTTGSSTVGNGILYLDLQSPVSAILLYYHNNTNDSLTYRIPVSGVRVNHFDNIYTGAPVNTSIATPNPTGEEKMYIQAGAGVKGKIFIRNLDSLPKNIAINKAELVLSQSAGDTTFSAPLLLNLYRIDDAGEGQRLEDDGTPGFDGVLTPEPVNGILINRYRFNIKRYFQKLIQGVYSNKGFYVQPVLPKTTSERVVIANSSTDKNYQVMLLITYTKL